VFTADYTRIVDDRTYHYDDIFSWETVQREVERSLVFMGSRS
jgi:hypothetical protein